MKIAFNNISNLQSTQQTSSINKTTAFDTKANTNTNVQRKKFDEILITTSSNANIHFEEIEEEKNLIIEEAQTPKSSEFLNALKSEIEAGTYEINIHTLTRNLMQSGML